MWRSPTQRMQAPASKALSRVSSFQLSCHRYSARSSSCLRLLHRREELLWLHRSRTKQREVSKEHYNSMKAIHIHGRGGPDRLVYEEAFRLAGEIADNEQVLWRNQERSRLQAESVRR